MRPRTLLTAVTLTGTLALTVSAVPAAQATAGPGTVGPGPGPGATSRSVSGSVPQNPASRAAADSVAPTIEDVSVHGGDAIVVGTSPDEVSFSAAVTASHPSGIDDAFVELWHGTDINVNGGSDGWLRPYADEEAAWCTASDPTTSRCVLDFPIFPYDFLYNNSFAGTWHVMVISYAHDGSVHEDDFYTTHLVQRRSELTVNAAPEPVAKGATLTVTGKLSRANWEDHAYHGYTGQSVELQFRKKDSSTYTTVKTVETDSTGNLRTTVVATTDGYWRYAFAGTTTTPAVKAAGDYVEVG